MAVVIEASTRAANVNTNKRSAHALPITPTDSASFNRARPERNQAIRSMFNLAADQIYRLLEYNLCLTSVSLLKPSPDAAAETGDDIARTLAKLGQIEGLEDR